MLDSALHTALCSRLFEQAIKAHEKKDFPVRDSLCFWVQMLDEPSLTRETVEMYIKGLRKTVKAPSRKVAEIIEAELIALERSALLN